MTPETTRAVTYDVAIVGGGPAGATAARLLARRGRRVVLFERQRFPRFHIGESLLPATNAVFRELDLADEVRAAGFVEKRGASFTTEDGEVASYVDFTATRAVAAPLTYQVPRARFDEILLDAAAAAGAEVYQEHRVRDAAFDPDGVVLTVAGPPGQEPGERTVRAAAVIDASGQAGFLAKRLALRKVDPAMRHVAVYAHYEGIDRPRRRPRPCRPVRHRRRIRRIRHSRERHLMKDLRALVALLILLAGAPLAAAAADPPDPDAPGLTPGERHAALLARLEHEQARLETLTASFVQHKESPLLLSPEESRGTFSFKAPDRVRWDYAVPGDTVVLVRDDEMVTWYRDLGRAEIVKLGRQGDRMLQLLGAAPSFDALQSYFTLRAAFPKDPAAPYRLELVPRLERVARRFRSMTFTIDRQRFIPLGVRWETPAGEVTDVRFSDLVVNGGLPADRFAVELPPDVEVKRLAPPGS